MLTVVVTFIVIILSSITALIFNKVYISKATAVYSQFLCGTRHGNCGNLTQTGLNALITISTSPYRSHIWVVGVTQPVISIGLPQSVLDSQGGNNPPSHYLEFVM